MKKVPLFENKIDTDKIVDDFLKNDPSKLAKNIKAMSINSKTEAILVRSKNK